MQAAVSSEGFLIVSPDREPLRAALSEVRPAGEPGADWRSWALVSNRRAAVDTLVSVDAISELDEGRQRDGIQYVGA
ncbi:hypothetical protein ACFSHT_36015 [Paraburkholderia silviterrae]|uniref:Uncharacterized protein n=1 Tax=Paraburkholderia silviterrae TaxID=2528715 RepID=A0A4R5M704_9BURK|nr:hypothetical protein [Paraburkholderia silviterrae]TDG21950.1 hypothetical protein EYW47_18820 [Paraburkholderia silviterrae]